MPRDDERTHDREREHTDVNEGSALAALHPQVPGMGLGDDQADRWNRCDGHADAAPGKRACPTSGHGTASAGWWRADGLKNRRAASSTTNTSTAMGATASSAV